MSGYGLVAGLKRENEAAIDTAVFIQCILSGRDANAHTTAILPHGIGGTDLLAATLTSSA